MEALHGLHRDGMSKDERFHWIGWVRSVLSPYLTGWTSIPRHWGFHPTIGCFPGIRRSLRDITNIEPVASLVKFLSMASNGESRLVQARGVWGELNFAALERWVHVNEQSCGPVITSTELILFVYLAMDWNLYDTIFFGGWTAIHQLFRYISIFTRGPQGFDPSHIPSRHHTLDFVRLLHSPRRLLHRLEAANIGKGEMEV